MNPADSFEHIIPECIGGRFKASILCTKCNSSTGSKLVSKIRQAPFMRQAARNLRNEIPEMFEKLKMDKSM
ncbi:MAG: HNH endonuclease [Firmicutes bacterium]|nr:HNH endonuclease [Bacillota bacterium]